LFAVGNPLERNWYDVHGKSSKFRLGKLFHATIKETRQARERSCIMRLIELPRLSAYVIENFQNRIIKLFHVQGIERFWL